MFAIKILGSYTNSKFNKMFPKKENSNFENTMGSRGNIFELPFIFRIKKKRKEVLSSIHLIIIHSRDDAVVQEMSLNAVESISKKKKF